MHLEQFVKLLPVFISKIKTARAIIHEETFWDDSVSGQTGTVLDYSLAADKEFLYNIIKSNNMSSTL